MDPDWLEGLHYDFHLLAKAGLQGRRKLLRLSVWLCDEWLLNRHTKSRKTQLEINALQHPESP